MTTSANVKTINKFTVLLYISIYCDNERIPPKIHWTPGNQRGFTSVVVTGKHDNKGAFKLINQIKKSSLLLTVKSFMILLVNLNVNVIVV